MERDPMTRLVIGIGFRDQASAQAIGEVIAAATRQADRIASAIAVPMDKAAHAGLITAARDAALPLVTVSAVAMDAADAHVITRSAQIENRRGVGSVCEAAALAGAGAGARLVVSRIVSADRCATAAAALSQESP
jgi:cobalt-precorrin 5A hydrolase